MSPFANYLLAVCLMATSLAMEEDPDDPEHRDFDDGCYLDSETERIQVAFVIDNTFTNWYFIKYLSETVKTMMDQINEMHDGTQFALTTHANWPQWAFSRAGYTQEEDCYSRKVKFTENSNEIVEAAKKVEYLYGPDTGGGEEENGVSALAFAASDRQLGWIEADIDRQGRRVHRFLVMVTDQWSLFQLKKPGNRTEFRGNGTDTCATSLPTSVEMLGKVLASTDTKVVGIYLTERSYKSYKDEFKAAGFGARHYAKDFSSIKNKEDEFKKVMSEYVVDRIRRFLRCVWDDPPAYNTLGL